jgi:hypothetical protein
MATALQLALITAFRKEAEDMINVLFKTIYEIQYGTLSATVGDNTVSLATAYSSINSYEIVFYEAMDVDVIDIRDSLVIEHKAVGGFTIVCERACSIRWATFLRTPNISYFTN